MSYPCVICDADLYETDTVAVCSFCGRETPAGYLCPNGHHVCEECQLADPLQVVEWVCEGTRERDPGTDGISDAHHHFAVEEALVRLVDEGISPPTLRLRQVQRAVFVGVYQDTWPNG
jgi:hypothetical protein